jgi:hypothetical protein
MPARIYQPAKTAVSSGRARTRYWVLEMEPKERCEPDALIGWVGSGDTEQQYVLRFSSKDEALAYARREGLDVVVEDPQERVVRPKSYSDNFIRRS